MNVVRRLKLRFLDLALACAVSGHASGWTLCILQDSPIGSLIDITCIPGNRLTSPAFLIYQILSPLLDQALTTSAATDQLSLET